MRRLTGQNWTQFCKTGTDLTCSYLQIALLDTILPIHDALQPTSEARSSETDARAHEPSISTSAKSSDFILSSHLHAPRLRLVYKPHVISVTLYHIPGFPEGWNRWRQYVSAEMTTSDALEQLMETLGVRKVIVQGTKTARVEYVLQVPGKDGAGELLLVAFNQPW